jgi:DNA-binding NarL/FixJ family response regulator
MKLDLLAQPAASGRHQLRRIEGCGGCGHPPPRGDPSGIGLPGLNGYEAARQIRDQQQGPAPTIVALTGLGQDEDRWCSEEAGFETHLVKPVNVLALMSLLANRDRGPRFKLSPARHGPVAARLH